MDALEDTYPLFGELPRLLILQFAGRIGINRLDLQRAHAPLNFSTTP